MLGPMDEFPVHQVPQPIAWPGSSDRNFYDRSYFNAHDRTGDIFVITGLGYYPNLGVKDAFFLVRRGDEQTAVHLSDAIDQDRLNQHVGGYRVEVHRTAAQGAHRAGGNRGHRRGPHLERAVRRRPGAAAPDAPGQPGHPRRPALRPIGFLERPSGDRWPAHRRRPGHLDRLARPVLGHPADR